MGNSTQSGQNFPVVKQSRKGEWILVGSTGYCEVVRHVETGQEADMYLITRDGRIPLAEDYRRYEFRRTNDHNLVQVLQVERENAQHMCQGTERLRVKTQRIPNRLSEVNLPLAEGLYVLHESLVGFKAINQYNGQVSITDEMIGFNQNGKVKVWLNTNFSTNLAESDSQIFEARRQQAPSAGEASMIDQLFSVVEQHIQGGRYPQRFSEEYNAARPATFNQALEFVKGFTSVSGIQVPGRISAISSQSSVAVGAVNTSVISQPEQVTTTTTTTTTTNEQVIGQSGGLVGTTSVSSPLHYTLNPVVNQQQATFVPQRSIRVLPPPQPQPILLTSVGSQGIISGGSQTSLPQGSQTFIPQRSQTFIPQQQTIVQPQQVSIQRPVVQQSISLPPTQSTLRSVVTSQQEAVAVSRIPVTNVVPPSTNRSKLTAQPQTELRTQVLRVPEIRQPAQQRQTVVQSNQVVQQRASLQNIRPLSPVQTIVQPVPTATNGARLFQHLNRGQVQSKTITATNSETVQRVQKPTTAIAEPSVIREVQKETARVDLVHGGTHASSKLHTHVYEGKTIVQNTQTSNNVQTSQERVVIQTQPQYQTQTTTSVVENSVQHVPIIKTEGRQNERIVIQQQPTPLRTYVSIPQQQTVTTSQTVTFHGLPHRHGTQNQLVSVIRQPEQVVTVPQQQQEVFVEETSETAVFTENGVVQAEVTRYTTTIEQNQNGREVVTIIQETDTLQQGGPEGLFEPRLEPEERAQVQITYERKDNPYIIQQQPQVLSFTQNTQPSYFQQTTTTIIDAENRPVVLKQSLPIVRTVVAPQTVITTGPQIITHQVVQQQQPQIITIHQQTRPQVVQETINYEQTEVYQDGRLVEQYEQVEYREQDADGNVYEEVEVVDREYVEVSQQQQPQQIIYQQQPQQIIYQQQQTYEPRVIRAEPQVIRTETYVRQPEVVVRTEPQIIRIEQPQVIKTEPQVIRVQPQPQVIQQVIRTEPQVIHSEPARVYIRQPEVVRVEPTYVIQEPQTQVVYRTQPEEQNYEEVEYREVEYVENEAGETEAVYEHEHHEYEQNGEYVTEDQYVEVQVVREDPRQQQYLQEQQYQQQLQYEKQQQQYQQQLQYQQQQEYHQYQQQQLAKQQGRVVAHYEEPQIIENEHYIITDARGNEVGEYEHEEVVDVVYDKQGNEQRITYQNDELVYEERGQLVHERIETVDYRDQEGQQHHVEEVQYDVEEDGVQQQYYERTEEVQLTEEEYAQQREREEYEEYQRQHAYYQQQQYEQEQRYLQQQQQQQQYAQQSGQQTLGQVWNQDGLQQRQLTPEEEEAYYRQQEEEAEYYRQQEEAEYYRQQQEAEYYQQQQQQEGLHRVVVQQSGGGQNLQYGEAPGNYEEEVAVIVQEDGQPVGYEVHQTEQYDTPEGQHVTVEQEYQVVYGQGDSEEVQYTHVETYQSKGVAIATTTVVSNSSNLPIGFEEGGIRYSSSSGGSGYRSSYEVDNYTTGVISSAAAPAYDYNYKPAASISSTLAGSYNQYATSPSSGLGASGTAGYGLADSNNYVSSSLKFSGTSPASGLPSYTNYQPNYNPPTVSPVTINSNYDYSTNYRAEPSTSYRATDTIGTSSKYDYLSGTAGGYGTTTSTTNKYDFTSGTTNYGTTDYTSGLTGSYTSGISSSFNQTGTSPTYDYLSRQLSSGAGYTGTGGITGTSLAGGYTSSLATSSLPSYDSLRSGLVSAQLSALPQYSSQTVVESVPLESGSATITTTTEEYTSGGAFGRSEYTSYSSQIVASGEGYHEYGF